MSDWPRGSFLSRLLRRRSCPLASPAVRPRPLRAGYLIPLAGFVVPNAVIGYGVVLPRAGLGGVNEITVGFAAALVGACVTYLVGVRLALRA
jgi:hypothetical protein